MAGGGEHSFYALPVQFTQGSSLVRHLYIKEYSSSEEGHATIPKNCGLFVAGLPYIPHDNSEVLTDLFGAFGAVERVAVHPSQTSAIVVFTEASSRRKAFKTAQSAKLVQLILAEPEEHYGLKGHVEAHKALFPGNDILRSQLDKWTEDFEAEEERRKREAAAALAEEGWTVVKRRGGGKKVSDGAGAAVGSVAPAAAQAIAASRKEQKVVDFYRFQQRDKRRNELVDLRRKFAEDKQRIAELKAARKFKPY
ncbi:hypothetical protein COCSUDRAFT_48184 [Coccomyxa subellipsoidea C-169]|uniref:RRM domain-containing protein n=1 Tax=Coccomyxa subellipsoidea (strain C-169) TaxID=574566 RepID=I0YT93_COCSC|nr:hypothetical protein COCSUDRAFT_48184 [Coccomyxa subellipsoidea C-169]EIE21612.1 hypothetical protein COCSUDRAFT_48184 [Coccomyxa subellipsoidea C-169]|eukprot:XP_005646156.1 hypothetical protein COCSUDRAFT_48184 [Coccomyxa subellipsoidea C-169]